MFEKFGKESEPDWQDHLIKGAKNLGILHDRSRERPKEGWDVLDDVLPDQVRTESAPETGGAESGSEAGTDSTSQ